MKKPWEKGFDLEFLSNPQFWPKDFCGHQRVCVKTLVTPGEKRGLATSCFGVIYAAEPLTVNILEAKGPTEEKEVFTSLEELVKVWMVD